MRLAKFLVLFLLTATCALAQSGNIGSNATATVNQFGVPVPGANVAVCQGMATTAASVASNTATLTMASNPVSAGFTALSTIEVQGFTSSDSYLDGQWQITAVTSTYIQFFIVHANASASSNGAVVQEGGVGQACLPLAAVWQDAASTISASNPFTSDSLGNWNVYGAPGNYWVQFYGTTLLTTIRPFTVACVPGNSASCGALLNATNVWTGSNTFQGTLACKNFQNIRCVDAANSAGWSGADAGAWINAAYADCGSANVCTIGYYFPATVNYTTTIAFTTKGRYPKLVNLGTCAPAASNAGLVGSCLNYTPVSGDAIDLDYYDTTANDPPSGTGLFEVAIINNQCLTTNGCGGTANGIHVLTTNGGADHATFLNVSVVGFGGVGYINTNSASAVSAWINPFFKANAVAMQHGSITETFTAGEFSGNGCIELAATNQSPELYFTNTNTFGNTAGGACAAAFDFSNVGTNIGFLSMDNVHLENSTANNAHYITGNVITSITGGVAEDDNSVGTGDWMFNLSTSQSTLTMRGTKFTSPRSYTNVFQMGGTGARAVVQAINSSPGPLTCTNFVGGAHAAGFTGMITQINQAVIAPCNWSYESPLQAGGAAAVLTGTGACATNSTQKGGAWAGQATCTGTTGASTFIITPGTTAPNGWNCTVYDRTTTANILSPTSTISATTCTVSGTVNANDVLTFTAVAY